MQGYDRQSSYTTAHYLTGLSDIHERFTQNPWKNRAISLSTILRRLFENLLVDSAYVLPRVAHSLLIFVADVMLITLALGEIIFNRWVISLLIAAAFLIY